MEESEQGGQHKAASQPSSEGANRERFRVLKKHLILADYVLGPIATVLGIGGGVFASYQYLLPGFLLFGAMLLVFFVLFHLHYRHGYKRKQNISLLSTVGCLSALVLVGTAFWAFDEEYPHAAITVVAAQPESPVVATPTFRTAMVARPGMTLIFGGMKLWDFSQPLTVNGIKPLVLSTDNGRVFCDVKILSIGTNEPLIIKHNQIQNMPFGWDANSNDDGMEIVNNANPPQPVFQMYYEGLTTIRIQGIVVVPPFIFLATRTALWPLTLDSPNLPDALKTFTLPRFFKYPSAMFPGVPN
jgi:hypothetical protein